MKASLRYEVTRKGLATEKVAPGGFLVKTNKTAAVAFYEKKVGDGGRNVVRLRKKR